MIAKDRMHMLPHPQPSSYVQTLIPNVVVFGEEKRASRGLDDGISVLIRRIMREFASSLSLSAI